MNYPKFVIKESTNEQYYFNLYSVNGRVIATSELYETKQGCKNGINAVKRDAPEAETDDQT